MLKAEEIKRYAKTLTIPEIGICGAERDGLFALHLKARRGAFPRACFEEKNIEKCVNPALLMPEAKSIIVCLFPYYIKEAPRGNISRYAGVQDYHRVVRDLLLELANFIKSLEPEAVCLPVCDTSPLMDRMLAYRAGLGFFGKNNLLIHPTYGSYCFIGSLITNLSLPSDEPIGRDCGACHACLKACPGGALSENFGFCCEKCVSYITQIKTISAEQKSILNGQKSVYGCDVCQAVCPWNEGIPDTPIQAFYEVPLQSIEKQDIEALSNRGFKRKYADYPFSWCSKETILKNFH
ncbi:MAG: tRNA epoxyqueuosine(34) reductase QueG [Clostridia bacterium]|nr:tRNA epoxyqueuosine(34) reductase QueG [Clostridia bacterium]